MYGKLVRSLGLAFGLSCTGLGMATAQGTATAENWPNKRITFIVPFSAGGSTDVVARLVASKLTNELGQPVIVDNKPGASGNIAGEFVARSAPDGYTFFVGTSTSIANISLFKSLPFDIIKDFAPVSQMVLTPLVVVANPGFPPKTISELIEHAKANPGKVNYGSGGSGTSQHIGGAVFAHLANVNMVHIPYKGAAPAMTDVISGQIQMMVAPLIDAMPFIKGNRVKVLGVTVPKEVPQLPGVPPIASVLPGYDVYTWNAIFAPAKTPPAITEKMSAAIAKVMKDPEVRKSIIDQGSEPVGSSSADFRKFIESEVGVWRKLIEISGAKPE